MCQSQGSVAPEDAGRCWNVAVFCLWRRMKRSLSLLLVDLEGKQEVRHLGLWSTATTWRSTQRESVCVLSPLWSLSDVSARNHHKIAWSRCQAEIRLGDGGGGRGLIIDQTVVSLGFFLFAWVKKSATNLSFYNFRSSLTRLEWKQTFEESMQLQGRDCSPPTTRNDHQEFGQSRRQCQWKMH